MRNLFGPKPKNNPVAGLLRIRSVGPGYLVLRNPDQYACLFKLAGGLNPWMEDPEVLGEKVRKVGFGFGGFEERGGSPIPDQKGFGRRGGRYPTF